MILFHKSDPYFAAGILQTTSSKTPSQQADQFGSTLWSTACRVCIFCSSTWKKVWIIDLDAVRCEWIKKSISHAVKVTHIIIFTFFGTKYIMQWNIGHINKIFSSPEKVKLILIYCPVHFQQLFIFLMPFYYLAKFILKFWHLSWYTPMEFRLDLVEDEHC